MVSNNYIKQIGIAGKEANLDVRIDEKEINGIKLFKPSFNGTLFKTIMQQLDIEVKSGEILTDKKIKSRYGLKINEEYEYINYNTFNVYSSEFNYDTNICKTIAYDNMVKFMTLYDTTKLRLKYPTDVLGLVKAICIYVGVDLYSTDFYNANLPIEEDLFSNLNCTYRDILDYICQVTCTTGVIKEDKLFFKNPTETGVIITPDILKKLKIKQAFGPCNSLVLGRGDLKDNIYSKDNESITRNGLQEIRFDNNEIIDKRRESVIDQMFSQIKGLYYNAFETTDLGIGIFEPCDIASMEDLDGNTYKVIILNQTLSINRGAAGSMSAEVPGSSTTQYQYATDSQKRQIRTEIIVNKQENKIEAVTEEMSEYEGKVAKVEQDIDSIRQNVGDIVDYKREISGATEMHLTDAGKADILKFEIRGNKTYESNLFPRTNLYPRPNLYPNQRGG